MSDHSFDMFIFQQRETGLFPIAIDLVAATPISDVPILFLSSRISTATQPGRPRNRDRPMQPSILATAPRCGARTRSGAPCRSPAIHGHQRCRMHGGKGSGAARGNRNALKHGLRSASHMAWKRSVAAYLRETNHLLRLAHLMLKAQRAARQAERSAALLRRREAAPIAKNKKSGEQPHAPGHRFGWAVEIGEMRARLKPPEIPAFAGMTHWGRAMTTQAGEGSQDRSGHAPGGIHRPPHPAPNQALKSLSKEILPPPQTSLICALRHHAPFGPHGILARS
jgi:hypothetical protein